MEKMPSQELFMGRIKNELKSWDDYALILLGSILTAVSINIFLVPYKIAPGGVTGLATVIYYLSGNRFPVGTTMFVLNVPLFLGGIKYIGKRFAAKTLIGAVLLSAIIDLTEPYTSIFVERFLKPGGLFSTPDLLLYSVFGGAIMGLGLGLVFRSGATTGGTDLAARIINHFVPGLTMGQLLLIVDTTVIIIASIAFNSILLGLYAIVTLFIASYVIDAILEGVNFAKAVFIISDKSEDISKKILVDLDRGVTALKGTGMYTGNDKNVLLCVVHRAQLTLLKDIVRSIDTKAFIILADIREVLGEGFKTYD